MLTIHWKAPLQPKGFLKIIELLVAILAFSLVAGFTVTGQTDCSDVISTYVKVQSKYPFFTYDQVATVVDASNSTYTIIGAHFSQRIISAQFFVAWGILTMFYCITALVVYMLFTANENLEKVVDMLIYIDLGFHFVWVLGWFIASVDWAVGFNSVRTLSNNVLTDVGNRLCGAGGFTRNPDTFVQASIADVFGFLSLFLWAVNIYWVLIDTVWFIQWRAKRSGAVY